MDNEIIDGWDGINEWQPRALTTVERHQIQQAELEEYMSNRTPFKLGEPIYT